MLYNESEDLTHPYGTQVFAPRLNRTCGAENFDVLQSWYMPKVYEDLKGVKQEPLVRSCDQNWPVRASVNTFYPVRSLLAIGLLASCQFNY